MESLASLYKNHIATLQERTRDALARFKLDALLIHSGELFNVFLDDHPYPFKVNPQFKAWVPVTQVPNCWLLVDGVNKPKLWFYLPVDYWHNVEPLPTSFWTEDVEVIALPKADGIGSLLPAARGNIGYIGPVPERALQLGIEASNINPKGVIAPAFFVSLPFSTNPIFSSHCWNSGMAVLPVSSRNAAVSRKPVVW